MEPDASGAPNLVLNAIDACNRGDMVNLDAEKTEISNQIDVVDPEDGSPEIVARIFEPLFTTKQGGNGLGLAIARNIARAHGSDIVLRINESRRVCFSIEIPCTQGASLSRGWTMGKVLVADDEPRCGGSHFES